MEELDKTPNDKCRSFIEGLPGVEPASFKKLLREASPSAVDFLHRTMLFDPEKRGNMTEALEHP